jgi:hypothetical protein
MKALFKVSPVMQFEIESDKQVDLFEDLASVQEVFGVVGNEECYLCKSKELKFTVRQNKDEDKFYEVVCLKCRGKLAFGCNKKGGTLYPVRKLKNGLPAKVEDTEPFDWTTKGWHKYDKEKAAGVTNSSKPVAQDTTRRR